MQYKVAEIFTSINGEGMCAGELAVFVRFCGCNLSCSYCDTMWANAADCEYKLMTCDEICETIYGAGIRNVTLTGGEPLGQPHIGVLIEKLVRDNRVRVEIETNGSVDIRSFLFEEEDKKTTIRPIFTMDYKLAGSKMEQAMNTENFGCLCRNDTVKFVVCDEADLIRAFDVSRRYGLNGRCNIILSPVFGKIEPEIIVDFMKNKKWNDARVQVQLHKVIWSPDKRGV